MLSISILRPKHKQQVTAKLFANYMKYYAFKPVKIDGFKKSLIRTYVRNRYSEHLDILLKKEQLKTIKNPLTASGR
ncbi:hypothetical protein NB22_08860 [Limosilactobacillus fermentum NB-22]|uniref:Uncharacterized protein n=1 Tax=Limosilactobacillus fermentum NB-22 TaxID=1408443 RepID=A0A829LSN2_LIMFE|nr:hypothetical protein NB22_08860 [Limosilactobacillus fermentum NB-22]